MAKSLAFITCLLAVLNAHLSLIVGQPQQQGQVVLPAQVIIGVPPLAAPVAPTQPAGTFSAMPPPPPAAPPSPSPVPPTPALAAVATVLPPVAECLPLDVTIQDKQDVFFILTRLVDVYTLTEQPPSPPLNASYAPLTILAPSSTVNFLRQNKIDIRSLASNPLQSILLAPTLASHFVRGYYPADALPVAPQPTLCGDICGDVQFIPGNPVTVHSVKNPAASVNITKPNVADCPGQWVVHEVNGYLFNNVTDPVQAAGPALDLSLALNGEWNTYPVV